MNHPPSTKPHGDLSSSWYTREVFLQQYHKTEASKPIRLMFMFSVNDKNHKWFIPFPHNIIPHEDLNRTPHRKNIQIPLAILQLNNKKFNQISSVFHFPWFCFFLSFFLLPYQPFLMLTPLCSLLPELPFLCRWTGNLLHPLYTPLGASLGISSVCFPHTHALPSWIFCVISSF